MPTNPYASGNYFQRKPRRGRAIHLELSRLPGAFLDTSGIPADSNGDKVIEPGLILAQATGGFAASDVTPSQTYYVPYNSGAAYGVGSDTAVGVLDERHDATLTDWQVAPVDRGTAYERRCYVAGGSLGDIAAAIKTNLSGIKWR